MKEMSTFKIVVIAIFAVCIVVGIALFALSKSSSSVQAANLVVWGTVSPDVFNSAYKNSTLSKNKAIQISYLKKDPSSFDADFVEALAEGVGPDIVILREDSVYKNTSKLFVIPYKNYTERKFKDSFIEEGELFLTPEGVVALPFIVDPMVMYWNRDLFANNLLSKPPQYWDEVYPIIEKITRKDSGGTVLQSALALGEWSNITNAKEIISMLLLQAGTPIVSRTVNGLSSVLNSKFNYTIPPSSSAVSFYTQFSNPTSPSYTWNRSLPSSLNFFLAGNLGMYIGFASDIFSIQQKNSNLNFDVTYIPQIRNAQKKTTFGHMYALAIVKQSKQIAGAFLALDALTEALALQSLEAVTNLPPVRRDLLVNAPSDAFRIVFYNSALFSRSWIDPNPKESSNTFRVMIESITSGQSLQGEALNNADQELNAQLK